MRALRRERSARGSARLASSRVRTWRSTSVSPKTSQTFCPELRTATAGLGMKIDLVRANTNTEINSAFETIAHKQAEGLWVGTGSLFLNSREQITSLAARYAIPAIYPLREFTDVGGLMSYGSSIADRSRLAGIYAGRILN